MVATIVADQRRQNMEQGACRWPRSGVEKLKVQ